MDNYRTMTDADEQMLDKLYKSDKNHVEIIVNDAFDMLGELKTNPMYQSIEGFIEGSKNCDNLFIKSFWALTGFMRYLDLYWQAEKKMLDEVEEPINRIREYVAKCEQEKDVFKTDSEKYDKSHFDAA